jgi:hypothetical protein
MRWVSRQILREGRSLSAGGDWAILLTPRAQQDFDWSVHTVWQVTFDLAVGDLGTVGAATQNIGSFSLQPATSRYWQTLYTWDSAAGDLWTFNDRAWDAGGSPLDHAVASGLPVGRWYRQSVVFDLSANRILSYSLVDLVTSATVASGTPADWFLNDGPGSALAAPAAMRFFVGGETDGNVVGVDNLGVTEVVPEPAQCGLAFALGALWLAWRRRATRAR